jgi:hypothetical protein
MKKTSAQKVVMKTDNKNIMITGHLDGFVVFWSLATSKAIKEIQVHTSDCRYIDIKPN